MGRPCQVHAPGHARSREFALLLDTGLRGGVLCALTLDAVRDRGRDEACRTLLVRRAKDGREREVQVGPTAANALWQYLHDTRCRRRHDCETERALFVMENGRPLYRRLLHEIVRAAGERARLAEQPPIVQGLRLRVIAERWAAYQRDHGANDNDGSGASDSVSDMEKGRLE